MRGLSGRCRRLDAPRQLRCHRIQVCGTKMCPNGELASDPQQTDRHRPDAEDMQKVPVAGHLRSANLIPGDGTKNGLSRSEQKTVSTTQQPLDRKSPIQVRIHLPPAESRVRTRLTEGKGGADKAARVLG